jgi:hypothetical protein
VFSPPPPEPPECAAAPVSVRPPPPPTAEIVVKPEPDIEDSPPSPVSANGLYVPAVPPVPTVIVYDMLFVTA